MMPPTVGFHNYLLRWPKKVDEMTHNQNVHRRRGDVCVPAEGQEIDLRYGSCLQSAWGNFLRYLPQTRDTSAASPAAEHPTQPGPGEMITLVGLDKHALKPPPVHSARKI